MQRRTTSGSPLLIRLEFESFCPHLPLSSQVQGCTGRRAQNQAATPTNRQLELRRPRPPCMHDGEIWWSQCVDKVTDVPRGHGRMRRQPLCDLRRPLRCGSVPNACCATNGGANPVLVELIRHGKPRRLAFSPGRRQNDCCPCQSHDTSQLKHLRRGELPRQHRKDPACDEPSAR